jgi:signal transduction histidine kinase/AmiR/NasT family two-component response regulator
LRFRASALIAIAFVLGVAGVARAGGDAPRMLAAAIERRATATSFASLASFGEAAASLPGREGLRRLHHVAIIFLNQSEFDRFEHFNTLLARRAAAEGDVRYAEVARIDELKSRYDRGDVSIQATISQLARSETDWFARVHAMTIESFLLIQQRQAGSALKELFGAETMIVKDDRDALFAESDVWSDIGIALIDMSDLEGSAAAFQKADFVWGDPAYPRPDFDNLYNLAYQAVRLGQEGLARDLVEAHHRLAQRSDLPHLAVWDKYLCAKKAEAFDPPSAVTDCLAGIDENLKGAEFLAPRILSMRSISLARQGQVDAAAADLVHLRALKGSADFPPSDFDREPQVAAELMAAQGQPGPAFGLLRDFMRVQAERQAQTSSAGASQMTTQLEAQLQDLRRQDDLEQKVVRGQRWIGLLSGALILGALFTLVWQRRTAGRLAAARQHAEAASLSKSEFLANMSHEIRTPLNGVVAVADMLADAGLPERERKMAEIIRTSGQSLDRLLSDVLDLARVEAGQLVIEAAPFHAGDLMRSIAALCRLRADEKGLSLDCEVDPALECWFLGDAVRVRQILLNLTSNAVKFTERGSVLLRGQAPAAGRLRFAVVDTGVGFDATAKERLFARFQQADGSITRRYGGSGLGLAISRQLAGLMGGEVDCESRAGEGSCFWFDAPFAAAEPSAEAAARRETTVAQGRPVRILVADDHATNQTVARLMLDQFGIESVVVDDGAKAVEAVRRGGFDAVLMDMQMPVMDGLEATRRIRSEELATSRARIPILMVSANALAEHKEAGRHAGADGHVSKPFTVSGLIGALNTVLEPVEQSPALLAAG